ncbi:MAG: SigE family RNA polymerase sigma factor [Arachnia sp.]
MKNSDADEEFSRFVTAHAAGLRRTAYLLTGSVPAAEDLLQDALVKVWLAWGRVEVSTATAYTRRTMAHLATDRWRRRRYATVPADHLETLPDSSAARRLDASDDRLFIVRQLANLSPRERAIVVLRYYDDLAEADVAAAVGCSVGTVKSTCSRALSRLRTRAEAARLTERSLS